MRISLGGVRDEAEIRGHRRTYVGALPGRILHALKKAKVKNPVVLLDEVDKLGVGWHGLARSGAARGARPRAEQDVHRSLPRDPVRLCRRCSSSARPTTSSASRRPLRDRLEIIELSGYTADEKLHIAKQHLIPKQLKAHAIGSGTLTITDEALACHRAGLHPRSRRAAARPRDHQAVPRAGARSGASERRRNRTSSTSRRAISSKYLGKARFFSEVAERTSVPGVATGLAWTPVGGDILFIETSRMPGKGRVEITGQLGDVMKESAKAALSYVRSHAERARRRHRSRSRRRTCTSTCRPAACRRTGLRRASRCSPRSRRSSPGEGCARTRR